MSSLSGPLFKWFGAKWHGSAHYPPPHVPGGPIIEPFAGSACYALRYPDNPVWIAESDPNIYLLWSWLIGEATEEEVMSIPLNLPIGADIRAMPLTDGQKLLVKSWQRTNNVGDCWTTSKWCNHPGMWTATSRNRVAASVARIKHWQVFLDGFALLENPDLAKSTTTTWLIDPPYLHNYRYREATPFDHDRLVAAVNELRGQVIVCEAVCQKTGAVPDYLPFEFHRRQVTSRRSAGNNTHSTELLYTRGPKR